MLASSRKPCDAANPMRRAFTPAGEPCGGPEGYWQDKAPHPSVG